MILHGNNYLWLVMKEVISLSRANVHVFSDSLSCLWIDGENPQSNYCLEDKLTWFKSSSQYRAFGHKWRRANGIRVEYFPRIHHIAARRRSPKVHEQNGRTRTIPRANYLHVDVQMAILWGSEDNEQESNENATLVSVFAKRFPAGRWSFFGPGSKKK